MSHDPAVPSDAGSRWEMAYWIDDPRDPIPAPYWRKYDHLEDAVSAAFDAAGTPRVSWLKVYPTRDEADVRARWDAEKGWHELSRTAEAVLRDRGLSLTPTHGES